MPHYELPGSLLRRLLQQNLAAPDRAPRNVPLNSYNAQNPRSRQIEALYESLSDRDPDHEFIPRKKSSSRQCHPSKYICFSMCLCTVLSLVIFALIVYNNFVLTTGMLQSLKRMKVPVKYFLDLNNQKPCPNGYLLFEETSSCYKATPIPTAFEDSVSACEADGAHLASIHSETENIFIAGFYHENYLKLIPTVIVPTAEPSYWIGLTRPNGTWSWLDGTFVDYRNWFEREQVPDVRYQQTSIAGTGTRWYRVKGGKRGFVCKKPSTHFAKKEKATTARAACPSGYIWFQSTESCYKAFINLTSFENAIENCSNSSSSLVSIHSHIENILVRGLLEKLMEQNGIKVMDMWIGLIHKSNKLSWVDGSPVDYEDWALGEPDHDEEDYAVMMPHWSSWKSAKPSTEKSFICKMN